MTNIKATIGCLLLLLAVLSSPVLAFERTTIAEYAQDVTPLLVGHFAQTPNYKPLMARQSA